MLALFTHSISISSRRIHHRFWILTVCRRYYYSHLQPLHTPASASTQPCVEISRARTIHPAQAVAVVSLLRPQQRQMIHTDSSLLLPVSTTGPITTTVLSPSPSSSNPSHDMSQTTTSHTDTVPPSAAAGPPPGYQLIQEGSAKMLFPSSDRTVFYNPVQVQNRDLSILMISLFAERYITRQVLQLKKRRNSLKILGYQDI